MSINQELLSKGLKKLLLLLLLFIIAPITLNVAFKAMGSSEVAPFIGYSLLGIAIVLIVVTLILAFKTFKTLLDALFNT